MLQYLLNKSDLGKGIMFHRGINIFGASSDDVLCPRIYELVEKSYQKC